MPSLKTSNHATNPTSPPLPKKDIVDPVCSDQPCESAPLSPANSEQGVIAGEAQDGPIKPKRSAPPPPPGGKLVLTCA